MCLQYALVVKTPLPPAIMLRNSQHQQVAGCLRVLGTGHIAMVIALELIWKILH